MTPAHRKHLMETDAPLTTAEIAAGFHFCREFDGLIVGPDDSEMEFCKCEGVPGREENAKRAKASNDKAWAEMPSWI